MRIALTRQELYDRVWAEPVDKLAKEFGLSNVGLGKACRRHNIPVPPRGYWARKAAGHKMRQPALPRSKDGDETVTVLEVRVLSREEEFRVGFERHKRDEDKKRLKQQQHQARLALKVERDRLWRERQTTTMKRVIYVVDVGSPTAGLAWARLEEDSESFPSGSADLQRAAVRIADDLRSGAAVAIGFEAPGFVPVPVEVSSLAKARSGEVRGNTCRPWSYGAGAYVTTLAIQLGAWLLRDIRTRLSGVPLPNLTLDPEAWTRSADVLLWEAFVSGPGHAREENSSGVSEHIQDAATAALAFRAWLSTKPRLPTAVSCDPRISTFGAIALWAGWGTDVGILSQECFVLWPAAHLATRVLPDMPDVAGSTAARNEAPDPNAAVRPIDRRADDEPAPPAVFSLICGDSHSFWGSHQGTEEARNFELLADLLRASPSRARQCEVTFDGGTTWIPLVLRLVSTAQISWKGHNAGASVAAKIAALVRT